MNQHPFRSLSYPAHRGVAHPPTSRPGVTFAQALVTVLVGAAFTTSTFDITGNVVVGGANLRIFNLLELVLIGVAALTVLNNDHLNLRVMRQMGLVALPMIAAVLVDFIAGEIQDRPGKATGYAIWLGLNGAFVVAGYLIGAHVLGAARILNLLLISYLLVCAIGAVQFVLGIAGVDFFVKQWWIEGRLPRLNAFLYEPSYFATLLLAGFVMSSEIWRSAPASMRFLPRLTSLVTGVMMILSSSRMGIGLMACYIAYVTGRDMISPRVPALRKLFTLTGAIGTVMASVLVAMVVGVPDWMLEMFLSGTGIGGTPDHSVSVRQGEMISTAAVFFDNPVIGVGYGNVGLLAFEHGYGGAVAIENPAGLTGMNIFLETLAGMGLVGFLLLAAVIWFIFRASGSVFPARSVAHRVFHRPLLAGFLAFMVILQFNQNIHRGYVWCHLFAVAAITGAAMTNRSPVRGRPTVGSAVRVLRPPGLRLN